MRVILLNTGTELLLGDVQDAHLAFIAREILPLGLRIEERRTVPDSDAIRQTLAELFPRCEILFVTGGLGPTSDDVTREMVADLLGLELRQSSELLASLRQRLRVRISIHRFNLRIFFCCRDLRASFSQCFGHL